MDDFTKNAKGSPSRDQFKFKHKSLNKAFWGADLDFVLVDKYPIPDIVAAIDYKTRTDDITFSEVIAYNALVLRGIHMYIVVGDVDTGEFAISRYWGGHHYKPITRTVEVYTTSNWDEFEEWEKKLRETAKRRFSPDAKG